MEKEEAVELIRSYMDTATTLLYESEALKIIMIKLLCTRRKPTEITIYEIDEWVKNAIATIIKINDNTVQTTNDEENEDQNK